MPINTIVCMPDSPEKDQLLEDLDNEHFPPPLTTKDPQEIYADWKEKLTDFQVAVVDLDHDERELLVGIIKEDFPGADVLGISKEGNEHPQCRKNIPNYSGGINLYAHLLEMTGLQFNQGL